MEVNSIVRGNEINHAGKLMEPTLFYGKKKKKLIPKDHSM